MDSNDTPAGGGHWEPPAVPHPQAVPPQVQPPMAYAPAAAQAPSPLMNTKLALVAGAVGLVAVGGIGGFVLGQSSSATAGTSTDSGRFGGGPPGMSGEGFSGQLPGGGSGPGGTTP